MNSPAPVVMHMFYHVLPHWPSWSLDADSLDIDLSPDMPWIKNIIVYYITFPLCTLIIIDLESSKVTALED